MSEKDSGELKTPGEGNSSLGRLIDGLALLPEKAMLDEKYLASLIGVTTRTIRRMVSRGELPPSIPFAGRSVWIAGRILEYVDKLACARLADVELESQRLRKYSL